MIFPIYQYFNNIDKQKPQNLINLILKMNWLLIYLKIKIIKYTDIYKIIRKVTSLNLYSSVNTIKDIINYHEEIENKIQKDKIITS